MKTGRATRRLKPRQYTTRRWAYNTYSFSSLIILMLFQQIDDIKGCNLKKKSINDIANSTHIKTTALYSRYIKWVKADRPHNTDHECFINVRGGKNRAFSDDEEILLLKKLKKDFLIPNYYIDNEILKLFAKKIYYEIHPYDSPNSFKASTGWCNWFKKKYGLSSKSISLHNAKEIPSYSDDLQWTIELRDHMENYGHDRIYAIDETFWRLFQGHPLLISEKGVDRRLANLPNIKDGFTATLIYRADGKVIRPQIIAKGKTPLSIEKFTKHIKDRNLCSFSYSPNGFSTPTTVRELFKECILNDNNNEPSLIIFDNYYSHHDGSLCLVLSQLNVEFFYLLPRSTSYRSVPDLIVPTIKQRSKLHFKRRYLENKSKMKIEGVPIFIDCYYQTDKDVIVNAFKKVMDHSLYPNISRLEEEAEEEIKTEFIFSKDKKKEKVANFIAEGHNQWINEFNLDLHHKGLILDYAHGYLDDMIIFAASNILSNQYPHTVGWKDLILGYAMTGLEISHYSDPTEINLLGINIVNNLNNHWLTLASINRIIYFFDSLNHGVLSENAKRFVPQLYSAEGINIEMQLVQCQQQTDSII